MTVSRLLETRGIISGVETNRGVIKADKVVVAAGVHSPQLLKTVGENVPVKPAKGYSVTIDVTGMTGVPAIPVHDDAMHAAVTPIGSRMRLVGTAEFAGFDKRLDPARVDNLFRLLEAVLPDIYRQVERRDSTPWTNLRPMSYDGCPFIGSAARLSGLFVNTGHGSLGWTMAMGSGELLADLVLGKSPEVDPRPFAFPRTRTSGPRRRSTIAF